MKTKGLGAGNSLNNDKTPPVLGEFAAITPTARTVADKIRARDKRRRVKDCQARAWTALDAGISNIEALTTDGFLKQRVANLIRTARYWRKKIESIHE